MKLPNCLVRVDHLDLLLLHADSIDVGFSGWSKNALAEGPWSNTHEGEGSGLRSERGFRVRVCYSKDKLGMRAQLKRVDLH
jgi:hypothetical protein